MDKELLEVEDVAKLLGEKESTVQNWVNRKLKIGSLFIRPGSRPLLRRVDYDSYIRRMS